MEVFSFSNDIVAKKCKQNSLHGELGCSRTTSLNKKRVFWKNEKFLISSKKYIYLQQKREIKF